MSRFLLAGLSWFAAGCAAAAVAAGAGGAVYYTDRGVESRLAVSMDKAFDATKQTFAEMGIKETKTISDSAEAKKTLEGEKDDREITVTVSTEGTGSHVEVVAKKTALTWDKDLAKQVLQMIVEKSK